MSSRKQREMLRLRRMEFDKRVAESRHEEPVVEEKTPEEEAPKKEAPKKRGRPTKKKEEE